MPKARIEEIKVVVRLSRKASNLRGTQTLKKWLENNRELGFQIPAQTGISDSMIKVLETESQLDDEMFEDWKRHKVRNRTILRKTILHTQKKSSNGFM